MPKCVLKQFIIREGSLKNQCYCYDFALKSFRVTTPDGVNTCEDYYRGELENELSGKIESPLGKLIAFIKSEDFQKQQFHLSPDLKEVIYQYLYSLITRSPEMLQHVEEQSLFSDFYVEQDFRSLTVAMGLATANENNLFRSYTPTFFMNNSNTPFILPLCGAYAVERASGEQWIYMPLTEKVAICLLDNRSLNKYVTDGKLARFSSNNHEVIRQLNQMAFLEQSKKGGCLISSSKEALEDAINIQNIQSFEIHQK